MLGRELHSRELPGLVNNRLEDRGGLLEQHLNPRVLREALGEGDHLGQDVLHTNRLSRVPLASLHGQEQRLLLRLQPAESSLLVGKIGLGSREPLLQPGNVSLQVFDALGRLGHRLALVVNLGLHVPEESLR